MQYSWRPQAGTQLKAITATWCEELFFGGARGGGKSDFLLGDFAQDVNIYKENWHGIIFRKIAKELDELIKRSNQIFTPMGAVFKVQEKKWSVFSWSEGFCEVDESLGERLWASGEAVNEDESGCRCRG